MKFLVSTFACIMMVAMTLNGQSLPFDPGVYFDFKAANEDIPPSKLYDLYPSDVFESAIPEYDTSMVLFLEEAKLNYNLTMDEKDLLKENGFMVSERLRGDSYAFLFEDVYHKDLPVFVSTDAILHAFHLSYDEILKQVEQAYLIPELKKLLNKGHSYLNSLDEKYRKLSRMKPMLYDVDVYFTVARRLLGDPVHAIYPENKTIVDEYLDLVYKENMETICFFSDSMCREIDFSQFKPRGHYETEEWEESNLPGYFRAMMWLGRMELYLDHDKYYLDEEVQATVNRQIVDAVLIHELFGMEGNAEILAGMEDIISFFVGEQDNVSPSSLGQLLLECELTSASELLFENNIVRFLDSLRQKPFASQQILSQVFKGNKDGTSRPLPSAFMPFGQRFVIDSYVTGQVVFDRIIHHEINPCRLVPSTLDIMFALGNNAATQLLIPELHKWQYSDNLAGLRFLIDQYGEDFWESSLYNLWLHAIESLSPDPSNEDLPAFMRTAAWGLEKLNTQLAGWTELRHDNLLYAKQTYASYGSCSHPEGYVEPNPEFFQRMKCLADIAAEKFLRINEQISTSFGDPENPDNNPVAYFRDMYAICDTLHTIASKELSNESLEEEECSFLDNVSYSRPCFSAGTFYTGWYAKLVYGEQELHMENLVVTDYHTTPTDCFGMPLGWVSHAGTGFPDMAIVVAPLANGELCAFTGPVASYHEFRTSDYLRLSDSEWKDEYLAKSYRPDWAYNYLADERGETLSTEMKFYTNWRELGDALNLNALSIRESEWQKQHIISVAPNPVEGSTLITIKIPEGSQGSPVRLSVCDLGGRMVRNLISGPIPSGYFITEWDRSNESGNMVPPGSYFLIWEQGELRHVEKLVVIN